MKKVRRSRANMGMCGYAKAEMGFGKGMKPIKIGSMKLLLNKSLGKIYRASDEKYLGKLRETEKGVYFMNNGKRVYLPKVRKTGGKRKSRKSRKGKGKRKSRKGKRKSKRKSRKAKRKSKRKSRKAKPKSRKAKRKSRKSKRKSRKAKRKSRKAKRKSRKGKRKSRKAKRKSRKSKRKSRKAKPKSRKSKRKAVKAPRGCVRQNSQKYTSRPSPPYPANECCGAEMEGNDGAMYVSKRDKHGVCRWRKL